MRLGVEIIQRLAGALAITKQLPRSICIEKKEFNLDWDNRLGGKNVGLSEVSYHKTFTMSLYPNSIDWLRASFTTPLKIPRSNRFFQEKKYYSYFLWIEKTSNKRGYIAEIYRLDDKGKKCCIMIPEGLLKKGWMTFHNMLIFKEQINPMAKDQNINNRQYSRNKLVINQDIEEIYIDLSEYTPTTAITISSPENSPLDMNNISNEALITSPISNIENSLEQLFDEAQETHTTNPKNTEKDEDNFEAQLTNWLKANNYCVVSIPSMQEIVKSNSERQKREQSL